MKNHNPVELNKTFSSAILFAACLYISSQAFAKEEWSHLYGNVGRCDICHTGTVGTQRNVKSTANSVYKSGGLSPGLKNYVASVLSNEMPNTKAPVLNQVNAQWDGIVGEPITIPLTYSDVDGDDAVVIATAKLPAGATLTDAGTDTDTHLARWDFTWIPTDAQKNKIYTLKFAAKETATSPKKTSSVVTTKVRVWSAGNRDTAKITSFALSIASWKTDTLTLKGKVVLNKMLSAAEKTTFLARTDLTVDIFQGNTASGTAIAMQLPVSFTSTGSWTLTQPLVVPFSCNVSLLFEGFPVYRKIAKTPASCIQ